MSATEARPECGVCGAAVGDGSRLCRNDQRKLCRDLDELADYLITELETTRSRQDRIGTPGRGAPGYGERPLAWNEHAAGVADVVASTVTAWALDCHHRDDDGDRDPLGALRADDLIGITRWLRRAMPVLRLHPEAELAHQQITSVAARARRAVDLPRTVSTFVVGPCPLRVDEAGQVQNDAQRRCEGTVRAYIGATDDAPSVMRCDGCRHQWGTSEWLRAGKLILARKVELARGLMQGRAAP